MKCIFSKEHLFSTFSVTSSMSHLLSNSKVKLNTEAFTRVELNIHSGHPLKTDCVFTW